MSIYIHQHIYLFSVYPTNLLEEAPLKSRTFLSYILPLCCPIIHAAMISKIVIANYLHYGLFSLLLHFKDLTPKVTTTLAPSSKCPAPPCRPLLLCAVSSSHTMMPHPCILHVHAYSFLRTPYKQVFSSFPWVTYIYYVSMGNGFIYFLQLYFLNYQDNTFVHFLQT